MDDDGVPVLHVVEEREWLAWAAHARKCAAGCRISLGEECAEAIPLRVALQEARARAGEPQAPTTAV